jgi:hypothetical protein
MPTYRFRDKTTGKTWTDFMTISARDELLLDENIEQLVNGAPMIVSKVGRFGHRVRPDDAFRDKLKEIKKANPKSTIDIP